MIQKYTQTTYETCLACCLLQATDKIKPIKITRKTELECINHSLGFSKTDFVIGHLDYIAKKYPVSIKRLVDNKPFYNYIKKIHSLSRIKNSVEKINLILIDQLLAKRPIVYIDSYYLYKITHYPHFITILDKRGSKYKIYDTWDGKEKLIEESVISKAISSLRNHLRFCPQILIVE